MSEEIKPYDPGDQVRKKLEEELESQKLIKETFEDLTNNPKYKEFFDKYHPGSVKSFPEDYANQKAQWMRSGEMFMNNELKRSIQFREDAEGYLWIINQKKMFNQQCLWRAGKIKLEGVESIFDFWHWERDTKRCPFLEPITREELELVKKAEDLGHLNDAGPLFMGNNPLAAMFFRWQGYDEFKKYYNENGGANPFPDWYNYYDLHFGTGDLFHLEDLRFAKEDRYCLIGHDFQFPEQKVMERHPEIEAEIERKISRPAPVVSIPPPIDKRPRLRSDDNSIMDFMNEFEEDYQIREWGTYCVRALEKSMNMDIDVDDMVNFLLNIEEIIPMKANWNWIEGLQSTENEYREKKKFESLEGVYEEYLLRLKNNIPLDCDHMYLSFAKTSKGMADAFKAKVLLGRKILGEPEDFNF